MPGVMDQLWQMLFAKQQASRPALDSNQIQQRYQDTMNTPAQALDVRGATQNYQDPSADIQAVGRFSHEPISIKGAMNTPVGQAANEITGVTNTTPGRNSTSDTTLYTQPDSSYAELQKILAHEQIHAVLEEQQNHSKQNYLTPKMESLDDAYWRANRAGDARSELPAYIGSKDRKINAPQTDKDEFVKQFTLANPRLADIYLRIMRSLPQ